MVSLVYKVRKNKHNTFLCIFIVVDAARECMHVYKKVMHCCHSLLCHALLPFQCVYMESLVGLELENRPRSTAVIRVMLDELSINLAI